MIIGKAKVVEVGDQECWIYLSSDQHIGCRDTDVAKLRSEIQRAADLGAYAVLNGDLFDLILPSDRKRFSMTALDRALTDDADIVNRVVAMAMDLYAPIADRIVAVGFGNHEYAVLKHHSVDVVQMFVDGIRASGGDPQYCGTEGGVVFRLQRPGNHTGSFRLWYTHGSGSVAPVTKGMIDLYRHGKSVVDADLITIGHKHNKISTHDARVRFTRDGTLYVDEAFSIMTGGYMKRSKTNYATYSSLPPQPTGGAYVKIALKRTGDSASVCCVKAVEYS